MKASTLTIEPVDAAGWQETAGVLETLQEQDSTAGYGALLTTVADGAGAALGGGYGSLVQGAGRVLGGLIDGKAQSGASAGAALGGLAGTALGTVLGGPAGSALGGAAGNVLGGLIGGAVDGARKKPSTRSARKAARAKAQAKMQARLARLEAAQAAQAKPSPPPRELAPARPALPARSDTGPRIVVHPAGDMPAGVTRPGTLPASAAPSPPIPMPEYPPELQAFRATLSAENAARLDQGVRERRGLDVLREILDERRAIGEMEAEIARERERETEQGTQLARAIAEDMGLETAAPNAAASPGAVHGAQREGVPAPTARENASAASTPSAVPVTSAAGGTSIAAGSPPASTAATPTNDKRQPGTPAAAAQLAREHRDMAAPQLDRDAEAQTTSSTFTRSLETRGAPRTPPGALPDDEEPGDTSGLYDDTAAPPAKRPQPKRHLGLIPMKQHQLEALLVKVPALRRLDTRLLRLMSGRGSTVRDTAGIDPSARVYVAMPGETAAGIAKKLTGREERAADLLAANPARREGEPWRIPPGWMHFVITDTGEPEDRPDTSGTSRFYIIQAGDTPVGIAQKSGAKAARSKWWAELKAANPQIPTKDNGQNFERFYAGQQLWIPEEWPASPMFQSAASPLPKLPINIPPIPGLPGLPSIPGLTTPATPGTTPQGTTPGTTPPNTTVDPGVPLHAQGMLAYWAISHPGACNPADFGLNVSDLTGTTGTRFVLALTSFQTWHNARNPAAPLRVDGVLDEATYKALFDATCGGVPVPGPGAIPWPKPTQPAPQPAGPLPPPSALLLSVLLGAASGVPGIHGGIPQLGGMSIPANANVPIRSLRSNPAPLPPGAVPGFHVAGQPASTVWDFDGTMVSLPPALQPLDTIYGTPPPDFVWQGGNSAPGPGNLPWVQAANPQPSSPTPWPWPWGPAPSGPATPEQQPLPTKPAGQPTSPQPAGQPTSPQTTPAKDDGALPIAGLLAALAFIS